MGNNKNIYVVYGTDFETEFGHKYFSSKNQAESYRLYKEKTKEFNFEKYHIDKIKIEDEDVDYSNIKLFSTVTLEFDNYESKSLFLEESKKNRTIKYFADTEENKVNKEIYFQVVVGDYKKPKVSLTYEFYIKDESEIEKLMPKLTKLNQKIIKEASRLSSLELNKNTNVKSDSDNHFIVSEMLDAQFKEEVEMIING